MDQCIDLRVYSLADCRPHGDWDGDFSVDRLVSPSVIDPTIEIWFRNYYLVSRCGGDGA